MQKNLKQTSTKVSILYNTILLLSRNKLFYTKIDLTDTFQNRINLIFIHISFLFIKIKKDNQNHIFKIFYQETFDLVFNRIEQNMREIGYGDTVINKNMKFLVKNFYNILLFCENYNKKNLKSKNMFFSKHLEQNKIQKGANNVSLVDYFDKYQAFCFDLSSESVLKGDLNFNYN